MSESEPPEIFTDHDRSDGDEEVLDPSETEEVDDAVPPFVFHRSTRTRIERRMQGIRGTNYYNNRPFLTVGNEQQRQLACSQIQTEQTNRRLFGVNATDIERGNRVLSSLKEAQSYADLSSQYTHPLKEPTRRDRNGVFIEEPLNVSVRSVMLSEYAEFLPAISSKKELKVLTKSGRDAAKHYRKMCDKNTAPDCDRVTYHINAYLTTLGYDVMCVQREILNAIVCLITDFIKEEKLGPEFLKVVHGISQVRSVENAMQQLDWACNRPDRMGKAYATLKMHKLQDFQKKYPINGRFATDYEVDSQNWRLTQSSNKLLKKYSTLDKKKKKLQKYISIY